MYKSYFREREDLKLGEKIHFYSKLAKLCNTVDQWFSKYNIEDYFESSKSQKEYEKRVRGFFKNSDHKSDTLLNQRFDSEQYSVREFLDDYVPFTRISYELINLKKECYKFKSEKLKKFIPSAIHLIPISEDGARVYLYYEIGKYSFHNPLHADMNFKNGDILNKYDTLKMIKDYLPKTWNRKVSKDETIPVKKIKLKPDNWNNDKSIKRKLIDELLKEVDSLKDYGIPFLK